MKDFLGNELSDGDYIVYCTRGGSWMGLIHAQVLEVFEDKVKAFPFDQSRRPTFYRDTRTGEIIQNMYSYAARKHWLYFGHDSRDCPGCPKKREGESRWSYHSGEMQPWIVEFRGAIRPVTLQHSKYIVRLK